MKKKNKILSLLALGLTVPAVMLTGCINGEVDHEASTVFAKNSTHHWYKCSCGDEDCELEYNKELHNFEEISRTTQGNTITVIMGCDCGEVKTTVYAHAAANEYLHNETHHWKGCGCGLSGCDKTFNKAEHDFSETSRTTEGNTTTINYACDVCGKTKTETIENQEPSALTEEEMFAKAKTLFDQYINFEKAYTLEQMGSTFSIDLENYGLISKSGFYVKKFVKDGSNFLAYITDGENKFTENYTLEELKTMISDQGFNMEFVLKLTNYADWKNAAEGLNIIKEGDVYVMTTRMNISADPDDVEIGTIQFNDDGIIRMETPYQSTHIITTFTNNFDLDLFNSFDVSDFPEPSQN